MSKKIFILVIIVIIIVAGVLIYQNQQQGQELKTQAVQIGFFSPLSGGASSWGVQHQRAVEMAAEEINAQGGIQFDVIYEDSKCDGKEAVTAVNKLVNVDGVKIVLGGTCSAETLAAKSIFEDNQVIDFSWGSSPEITPDSEYIFRNSPSDDDAGKLLAREIYSNYQELALFYENADFSKTFSEVVKAEFERLGGKIVAEEITQPETKDFKVSVSKIKASNAPAILFVGGSDTNAWGLMAKQMREGGIDAQLYSSYLGLSIIEAAGLENIKGTVYVDSPALSETNQKSIDFLAKYETKYNEKPQGSEFYAAAAYDSLYIMNQVLQKCEASDTECIKQELPKLKFSGALGNYGFTSNGDVDGINYSIKVVE